MDFVLKRATQPPSQLRREWLGLGPADALQEAGLLLRAHALQGLLGLGPRVLRFELTG